MKPGRLVAGLAPSILLTAALASSTAAAGPTPLARTSAVQNAPTLLPHASAPGPRTAAPPAGSSDTDGRWQPFGLLQVAHALAVYDQAHDQLLSLGGPKAENWALPLAGPPDWQPLPRAARPRSLAFSVQDPSTGLVYFVDWEGESSFIRTLDPQTGVVTTVTEMPPAMPGPVAFDAANHRLLLYGYYPWEPAHVAVWVLDLLPAPTWSQLEPAGTAPPWIYHAPAVVDPVRRNMLFNIIGNSTEIWGIPLEGPPRWLRFVTNGLPTGATAAVVYDPASDRLWTIDGQCEPYSLSLETFQWSHVPALGPSPPPRWGAGIAIDAARHRLLVTGGASGDDTYSDTWALSLDGTPAWTRLVPDATHPPTRGGASDGYDAARGRLVVFGGSKGHDLSVRNDTWVLDLGPGPRWSPLATQGTLPPARYGHVSAWDEERDQLVIYGGTDKSFYPSTPLADLWALSFAGGTPTWSPITPAAPAPAGRFWSNLVYDSARDRFRLLFGSDRVQAFDDVWELRLSPTPAWRLLAPAGAPPAARLGAMAVYDPNRDRVLVFGGSTPAGALDDLWALNVGSGDGDWQRLSVPSGPSPRHSGLLCLDSGHDRIVLFGGTDRHAVYDGNLNDTWALSLTETPAWELIAPAGPEPPGRHQANGAYDSRYDRIVLACGGTPGSNDVWTLTFGDAPTLLAVASRDVSAEHVRLVWTGAEPGAAFTAYRRDPGGEWQSLAALSADGAGSATLEDLNVTPGTTIEYRLGATIGGIEMFFGTAVVQIPHRLLSLAALAVDGRVSFTVVLPTGDPATLSLFDVAGRRVWSRPVGQLGPGSHEVSAGDAALPSSLYFARLTQAEASRLVRVLIVH